MKINGEQYAWGDCEVEDVAFFHVKMPISQKYICPGNEKQESPHTLLSWT